MSVIVYEPNRLYKEQQVKVGLMYLALSCGNYPPKTKMIDTLSVMIPTHNKDVYVVDDNGVAWELSARNDWTLYEGETPFN